MAGDTTRGSERDISLAVRLERGIGHKRWRRRTGHVGLFGEVGIRSRSSSRGQFGAVEVARPLRAYQHVIVPDGAL